LFFATLISFSGAQNSVFGVRYFPILYFSARGTCAEEKCKIAAIGNAEDKIFSARKKIEIAKNKIPTQKVFWVLQFSF